MQFGVSYLAIIPDHVLKCHPFVSKSIFQLEGNEEESDRSSCADDEADPEYQPMFQYDRPSRFVINDDPSLGQASFRAVKWRHGTPSTDDKMAAVAVMEYGTKNM